MAYLSAEKLGVNETKVLMTKTIKDISGNLVTVLDEHKSKSYGDGEIARQLKGAQERLKIAQDFDEKAYKAELIASAEADVTMWSSISTESKRSL